MNTVGRVQEQVPLTSERTQSVDSTKILASPQRPIEIVSQYSEEHGN